MPPQIKFVIIKWWNWWLLDSTVNISKKTTKTIVGLLSQPNNDHNPNNKTTTTEVGLRQSNCWDHQTNLISLVDKSIWLLRRISIWEFFSNSIHLGKGSKECLSFPTFLETHPLTPPNVGKYCIFESDPSGDFSLFHFSHIGVMKHVISKNRKNCLWSLEHSWEVNFLLTVNFHDYYQTLSLLHTCSLHWYWLKSITVNLTQNLWRMYNILAPHKYATQNLIW